MTSVMLLSVEDLTIRFRGSRGPSVDGVSFDLAAGSALGIVGESGSGKSQTARAIVGLSADDAEVQGSVRFEGVELISAPDSVLNHVRGVRIGMVFQNPSSCLNPYLRVDVQMAEMLQLHRGMTRSDALVECRRLLDCVQVSDVARRLRQYPHELSGGLCQRVMVAMALSCQPSLLIADEPTTALDVTVQAQMLDLLAQLRRDFGLALLLISHDLGVVAELCEAVLVLNGGHVIEWGSVSEIMSHPQHAYTRHLLACRPGSRGIKGASGYGLFEKGGAVT
ncbi:ABC transporter ATP-binding protein [Sinimarinibacterium sp. CAU 1509]|uniref:ABC transporter ATP-binding protein n=1 Tax=Sinimarinibacterium sp. CAU 1509 TaxID=2562283 RepID=UPI0010ABF0D5|nr:ABC transporter ATP-binding protein [Sinimarinibacterium sp. CAU 1509]TJY56776.1 ABC transporter ATP-binding protein [Sinimarinibacterium sp. CAU 1509]